MKRKITILIIWFFAPMFFFSNFSSGQDLDSHRIIELEDEVIEGRIEKPEAFYILQPTNLNYEAAELEESFIPELLDTVEEDPF